MAVVYQIERRGARPRAKKFLASSENVANVEMLPVPMLPMANGTRRGRAPFGPGDGATFMEWHTACPWDVRSSFAVRVLCAHRR